MMVELHWSLLMDGEIYDNDYNDAWSFRASWTMLSPRVI
jgi:hypothetical protein